MKRYRNRLFLLIFSFGMLSAQVNVKFMEHLSQYRLKKEYTSYLSQIKCPPDSLAYFHAKYYFKNFNDSLFLYHSFESNTLVMKDTLLLQKASALFLASENSGYQKLWFEVYQQPEIGARNRSIYKVYTAAQKPFLFTPDSFPEGLRTSFLQYKKASSKKPWVGGVFSAVVPGFGKLYAGKPHSALSAFLLNASYAAQSIESINKLGIRHPFTLINVCAFAVFYSANIYGACKSVNEQKSQKKKQFLHDAAFYYN